MKTETTVVGTEPQPNCSVNSTFNFAMGGLAIVAALVLCYLAYMYWSK